MNDRKDWLDQQAKQGPLQTHSSWLMQLRQRTPARLFVGRSGPGYRTDTLLRLRQDHAAALDAVHAELDLETGFIQEWNLFFVQTEATSKKEYLMRPDLGRRLSEASRQAIEERCQRGSDLQIVLGDGLSAAALAAQGPVLLQLLMKEAQSAGLKIGQPFVVRYCRVGVLNDIGVLLDPSVVLLLIGERPGLATAVSLSAYLAYRPRPGDTDAKRNLISNIHAQGVQPVEAASRVLALVQKMRALGSSGVTLKEDLPNGHPPAIRPAPAALPDADSLSSKPEDPR